MKPLPLLFFAFVFFGACNNAAHEQTYREKQDSIMKAFKEANEHIQTSTSPENKCKELYEMIKTNNSIPSGQKMLADSLMAVYKTTIDFISETKNKLGLTEDKAGTNVMNKIMIGEKNGMKLYHLLDRYSKLAIASCGSTPNAKTEEDIFAFLRSNTSATEFTKVYFENIPKAAVITMLSKFGNDCKKAQLIALEELNKAR